MSDKTALCGDIGGTNDDMNIVSFKGERMDTEFLKHSSTPDTSQFVQSINSYLAHAKEEKGLEPKVACFAVAGPVRDRKVQLSNTDLRIDADKIEKKTSLDRVILINDFAAVGHSVNALQEEDYRVVQEGRERTQTKKAVVGAGTGLGKSILVYNKESNSYVPHTSEGGHADLPMFDKDEHDMADYIAEQQRVERLTYDDVLSGRGLESIYNYLRQKEYVDSAENLSAEQISNTKGRNPCSNEAFDVFMKFYARCVRNFALETYSTGGMYIAGGIAAKNHEMFDEYFLDRFHDAPSDRFQKLLENMPVKLIKSQNIGLRGAAQALKTRGIV